MRQEEQKNHLVKVKQSLAEKYARLARASKSKPRRRRLLNRMEDYRRQAEDIARQ